MKKLILSAMLLTTLKAVAMPFNMPPEKGDGLVKKIAAVEATIVLQRNDEVNKPRISVVKVDNGGSSDISSVLAPSSLYLTIHLDGEMFDVDGTYLISDRMKALKSAVYDINTKSVLVEFTQVDENSITKINNVKLKLLLKQALGEATKANDQGLDGNGDFNLETSIGIETVY